MAKGIKSGTEIAWKWILVVVALTFLGIYLLNNLKPGRFIEPVIVPGFVSSPALPTDPELIPLGEEEAYYEGSEFA